jgi:tetratricopeptide (TPR) repeat protein
MTGRHKGVKAKAFFILFAFMFLCFLFFGGCAQPRAKKIAVQDITASPTGKTEKELLELLERRFENPQVHYELGRLYHSEKRWDKAEYHYNNALSFDPSHRPAQAAIVKMLFDSDQSAKAEQFAKNYIFQVSESAVGSLYLALAFEAEALDEYALICFKQAIGLAPNSADVNKQFGLYCLRKADTSRAEEYLSRSFELNPNQPDVAGELGRLGVVVQVPQGP